MSVTMVPDENDANVLVYVRLNVGSKLIKALTDIIAAGAPVSKAAAATAATSSNVGGVRRLHLAFSPNRLRMTSSEGSDKDISVSAVLNDEHVFSKYVLKWDNELMVGVPMDAFRKAFGGYSDSSSSTSVGPDPVDVIVTTGTNCSDSWPRSIMFYNPNNKSGCETSCMLVPNVIQEDYSRSIRLLSTQPVDLVSLHAELGGVESKFTVSVRDGIMCIANDMGSSTRKWRQFKCEDIPPGYEFEMQIRSSLIHNIQKLKTITNLITVYKKLPKDHMIVDDDEDDYEYYDDDDADGLIIVAKLGPSTGSTRSKLKPKKKPTNNGNSDDGTQSSNLAVAPVIFGELVIHLNESCKSTSV